MSVAALRSGQPAGPGLVRLALAAGAIVLVGGIVALLVWIFAPATLAPAPKNPLGMGLREAAPSASAFGRLILHYQGAFFLALKTALFALRTDPAAAWSLVGLGFAYGVFHAAGPGHGKAVISSYILSSERALAKGLVLSLAAALLQSIIAIALVGAVFILVGGTAATMDRTANVVELSGFALVALLGAVVTWRKAGKVLGLLRLRDGQIGAAGADCGCDHVHLPPPEQLERSSPREMAAIALGAGIRPCAGAILVLVLALSQHLLWAGVAATLAMGLGTAVNLGPSEHQGSHKVWGTQLDNTGRFRAIGLE